MKSIKMSFDKMIAAVPDDIRQEVELEFAISNRICALMEKQGLSKIAFAKALDKKPSEVTKWLSGQHNFTLRTISLISSFFGEPLIQVKY
ncbi:MAG: helix-turn-helix domain-containing protein [Bacteroides sp.]|nr:helix-turn-helix domain-containing protein [Ruminococcus flavefaciens]MCM1554177.1 helix-turn-helix domain-containing protein [Bacteroides sp.]